MIEADKYFKEYQPDLTKNPVATTGYLRIFIQKHGMLNSGLNLRPYFKGEACRELSAVKHCNAKLLRLDIVIKAFSPLVSLNLEKGPAADDTAKLINSLCVANINPEKFCKDLYVLFNVYADCLDEIYENFQCDYFKKAAGPNYDSILERIKRVSEAHREVARYTPEYLLQANR